MANSDKIRIIALQKALGLAKRIMKSCADNQNHYGLAEALDEIEEIEIGIGRLPK